MPAPLFIRADASAQMGTGHVMRCLALAEPWRRAGGEAVLASANLPQPLADRARQAGLEVVEIAAPAGSPADAQETARLARACAAAWVVADGYHFDADFQHALKEAGHRLLWVDDFAHARAYCADLILNQNLGMSAGDYPALPSSSQLLLGCRYAVLRQEFQAWRARPRALPAQAARLLVTLGGSDPANTTLEVIRALQTPGIPFPPADIVIGGGNPHRAELEAAWHGNGRLLYNVTDMPALMAGADLAIAAGGTTAWELAFMGLPAMMFTLADNQALNCARLDALGAARNLGRPGRLTPAALAAQIHALAGDVAARTAMSEAGRKLVDGQGAWRVWLRLQEPRLRLRPVTEADCRLIWEWANAPEVRAVSFASEPIPWERHVAWFAAQRENPLRRFWLAEDDQGQPFGQVRFDMEGAHATISISLAASARGRGLGALLIWAASRQLFRACPAIQSITAFIKPGNSASTRAFEKAGFAPRPDAVVKGERALRYACARADAEL